MTHSSWAGPKSDDYGALERNTLALGVRGHALGRGGGEIAGGITGEEQSRMSSTKRLVTRRGEGMVARWRFSSEEGVGVGVAGDDLGISETMAAVAMTTRGGAASSGLRWQNLDKKER
jgi:hypothetical protein